MLLADTYRQRQQNCTSPWRVASLNFVLTITTPEKYLYFVELVGILPGNLINSFIPYLLSNLNSSSVMSSPTHPVT